MSAPGSPPSSPRKGKMLLCKILLLDDTWQNFYVPPKSLGQFLFMEVVKKLQLLESDYFDLEYIDHHGVACWLDHEKSVHKQMSSNDPVFKFLVKFYTPDPGLLEEEYTRYLFALQVKRDLYTGAMPCHEHTAVLLASYLVQAELGDFIEEEYTDSSYLMKVKLLPGQNEELLLKVMEHHREHIGQSPEQADFNLLDTGRKVELYGIRMHPAKDHEAVPLQLAVAHMGVLVFQNYTKINTFSWAKIRKLSFKRKKFLIKLHPEGYSSGGHGSSSLGTSGLQGYYKDTVEFYFDSRNECKNFWKKCIEHHAFFRCHQVKRLPRNKTRVVSRGSSFRYSGRTQKQLVEYVRENYVKRPNFERTASTPRLGHGHRRLDSPSSQRNHNGGPLTPPTPRTTSMRTMSSSRSAGATPKTGTLNSRDVHFGHNASTSSGSHTLEMSRSHENMMDQQHVMRVEKAEIHDDSSHGSRSLSSPPQDRVRVPSSESFHQQPQAPPPSYSELTDHDRRLQHQQQQQQLQQQQQQAAEASKGAHGDRSPRVRRLDPAQFMLSQQDRKMSAPAFPVMDDSQAFDEHMLPRSAEMENIPQRVATQQEPGYEPQRMPQKEYYMTPNLHRSQSATANTSLERYHDNRPPVTSTISEEETLPPPPPPIYEDETPRERERMKTAWATSHDHTLLSQSTTSQASMTLTSNASVTSSRGTEESEDDSRRKLRSPADKAYYIAKELLMTERTYKKDLEVITVWFRNAVSHDAVVPEGIGDLLFATLDPIYEFHVTLLKEVEQRLAMWEGKSNAHLNGEYKRIGDVMLNNMKVLQLYLSYMEHQEDIMSELEASTRRNRGFEQVYSDFESQKVCYLPFNTFLLKPAQRLLHYKLILERLLKHYTPDHIDYADCHASLSKILEVTASLESRLKNLENLQKLIELQRDLGGVDNLVVTNRAFIREGCLQKLSRKGYQQRMFFLFSDMLVYTSRTTQPTLQFKVHGQLPLRGMIVEETDAKMAVANSFTIYGGNRCLLVAASSQEEKDKWLEDLQRSIYESKERGDDPKILYPSLKSNSSSEALEDSHDDSRGPPTPDRQSQHRANTTMHVCWHRSTSVSMKDHNIAVENQLSGYLLRKFKNSNGWQKLWVVFTSFCLFFYKTFQDDYPLASLPLLGYSVTTPSEADGIHKDYVFKLQFKNHVYFFRAESEYTFERWIEVIKSATESSHRLRLFSRLDSVHNNNSVH